MKQGRRTSQGVIVALLAFAPASAHAQPNMLHVLERVAAQYPAVWQAAHRDYNAGQGQPGYTTKWQAELFVRLSAWKMNEADLGGQHEGRWGVNGKRGVCSDLSQDVIVYRLGQNLNKGWDVIPGAGGPSPSLAWGEGYPPSTDAQGCFVLGTPITNDEVAHVMNGGRPFAPKPFPYSTIALADGASQVVAAFQARHGRPMNEAEIGLFAAWAGELGWTGGDRIPKRVVAELVKRAQRYSGDVANPFPTVTPDEALRRLNQRWQARFGRDVHTVEQRVIIDYALTQWNGQGDVPLWLLDEILAASDQYDGSLVAGLPKPVDLNAEASVEMVDGYRELFIGGERFDWLGQTAFLLQYDYFTAPDRFVAAVDAMVAAGVTGARVGVTVGTGYLVLEPRSGGTFGSGRTVPLHPWNTPNFWPRYRLMLAYLASRGIVAEVVPFLTAGAYSTGTCGERANPDTSVPQSMSEAARMAYLEEVARELLPVRALMVEIANEYLFIGFCADGHEVDRLAARYKAIDPAREVTTSAYHPRFGDYRTVHSDRFTEPETWAWIIEQLRYPRPDVWTVNDEGINGDLVGEYGNDASPNNHWANGVLHRLVPGLNYTFHFDRALKGLPPSTGDGSLQAINAWRDGTRAVPANVTGKYIAAPNVLGADAAVARLSDTEGWLLLIGSSATAFDLPDWDEALVGSAGAHRLYKLARSVH